MYINRRQTRLTFSFIRNYEYYLLVIVMCLFFVQGELKAQISSGGAPKSFTVTLPANIDSKNMRAVNVDALRAEDELQELRGLPPRFGFALDVDLGLNNAGTWHTLPDGGRIWRLRIIAPGAFSVNLIYNEFRLPPGATFFIYNQNKSMVIGAFTEQNNKAHGKFSTAPLKGPVSILEYYEPANSEKAGVISISKVIHGYKNFFGISQSLQKDRNNDFNWIQGFGDAASCNINTACSEGASWRKEEPSVAMTLLSDNTRLCSGALVNNENEDFTPYFLTAFHCADTNPYNNILSSSEKSDAETWIFMFNYRSATCSNPSTEPSTSYSISGSTFRSAKFNSDFLLLEISTKPPMSYQAYFSGWSNVNTAPNSSVGIHHPENDIKKISIEDDAAVSSGLDVPGGTYPDDSHWKVTWNDGTTEHGSSGSPLFDPNHRIVGKLTAASTPP